MFNFFSRAQPPSVAEEANPQEEWVRRNLYKRPPGLKIPKGHDLHIFVCGIPGSGHEAVCNELKELLTESYAVNPPKISKLFYFQNPNPLATVDKDTHINLFELQHCSVLPNRIAEETHSKMMALKCTSAFNRITIHQENSRTACSVLAETLREHNIMSISSYLDFQWSNCERTRLMHESLHHERMLFVIVNTPIATCLSNLQNRAPKDTDDEYTKDGILAMAQLFTKELLESMQEKLLKQFMYSKSILEFPQIILECRESYTLSTNAMNFALTKIMDTIKLLSDNLSNTKTFHPFPHLTSFFTASEAINRYQSSDIEVKLMIRTNRHVYQQPQEFKSSQNATTHDKDLLDSVFSNFANANAASSSSASDSQLLLQIIETQVKEQVSQEMEKFKRETSMQQPLTDQAVDLTLVE